jgi:lambda repressor-like predicted transcriptional regulator
MLTFTFGDLIVLLLVAVVLVIYRHLDKNNRSLERVKKFADQAQVQLQEIVDAKARDLKDLGIEVEVHQQTLKTVLNHVHQSTESLEAKAKEIDTLSTTIHSYQELIDDLSNRTKAVHENLQRVKEESKFVDGVGKRIKEASDQIQKLEKSIPQLIKEFDQKNSQDLENLSISIRKDFTQALSQAQSTFQAQQAELTQWMTTLKQDLEDEKILFEDKAAAFQITSQQAMDGFNQHITDSVELGKALKLEILEAFSSQFRQELSDAGEKLTQSVDEMMQQQMESEDQLKEWKVSFRQRMNQIQEEMVSSIKEQEEGMQKDLATLSNQFDQFTQELDQKVDEIARNQEEVLEQARELVRQQQQEFSVLLYNSEEKLRNDLEQVREKGNSMADIALTKMNQDIEAKTESIRSKIQESLDDLTRRTESSHRTIDHNFSNLQQQLDSYIADSKGFIENLDARMIDLNQRLGQDKELHERMLEDFITSSKDRIQTQEDSIAERLQELSNQLFQVRRDAETTVHGFKADLSTEIQQASDGFDLQLQGVKDEGLALTEEVKRIINERIETIKQSSTGSLGSLKEDIEKEFNQVSETFIQLRQTQQDQLRDTTSGFQQDIALFREEAEASAMTEQQRFQELLASHDQQIQTKISNAAQDLQRLAELQANLNDKSKQFYLEFEQQQQDFKGSAEQSFLELHHLVRSQSQLVESKAMKELDIRLRDYEESFGYRIHSLEQVSADVTNLDHELRKTLERTSIRLTDDLRQMSQQLKQDRQQDLVKAKSEMESLLSDMVTFETSLNELKDRAYQTTSEKLKLFEEDFFADLRLRSEKIDNQMEEWILNVRTKLQDIETNTDHKAQGIEQDFIKKIELVTKSMQDQAQQQIERISQEITQETQQLQSRVSQEQQRIRDKQQQNLEELQQFYDSFVIKLEDVEKMLIQTQESKQRALSETLGVRVRTIEEQTEQKTQEIQQLFENVRSDVAIWQNRYLQQIKQSESNLDTEIDQVRNSVSQELEQLRMSVEDKTQAVESNLDDRLTSISQMVQQSEKKVQMSYEALEAFSDKTLEEFANSKETMQVEIQSSLRDFRTQSQRLEMEYLEQQKKLMEALENRTNQLDSTLEEIDRRQKQFISQTKLFERADSMKEELTLDIQRLNGQIDELRQEKKDFASVEQLVQQLKVLSADSASKVEFILSERKQLESIEQNVQKLLKLADSVDQRILEARDSHDQLLELQKAMRDLNDLERMVEQRFDRLEKKSGILETTIEGVDKNFQQLSQLENSFTRIYEDIENTIPNRLLTIDTQIAQITLKKKEADLAIKNLGQIDGLLKDLEKRLGEIQQQREWLARTETRFEDITRQATDQVQILSTLVKDELKQQNDNPDEIPKSARDLVIRLAHQGWKIEEIARTTKLSRGEVELILEMKTK